MNRETEKDYKAKIEQLRMIIAVMQKDRHKEQRRWQRKWRKRIRKMLKNR